MLKHKLDKDNTVYLSISEAREVFKSQKITVNDFEQAKIREYTYGYPYFNVKSIEIIENVIISPGCLAMPREVLCKIFEVDTIPRAKKKYVNGVVISDEMYESLLKNSQSTPDRANETPN